MKKLRLDIELEYDVSVMHRENAEDYAWFRNEFLLNTNPDFGFILHSNETGDEVGPVKVLAVHDKPLEWTSNPPTEPGWYWRRFVVSPDAMHVVRVYRNVRGELSEMDDDLEECLIIPNQRIEWWPDPIKQPKA